MAENKISFLLYCDIVHTVRKLSNEQAGQLFKHILSYANDENPEANDVITELVFEPIKQGMIRYNKSQRYGGFHWNWKGGISPVNQVVRNCLQMKQWRISVFERDNYTCQICNKKGGIINAHHIKKFSDFLELRLDVSNGITLCKDCHKKIHSTKKNNYGRQ